MIYVSTSCVRFRKISESVEFLAKSGFTNIELSGGTDYYEGFEEDLLRLKETYNLSYLLHNYFPPPKKHFVLNLASMDDEIYERSLAHYLDAIRLAGKLGSEKTGIHAGYFIDPKVDELGKKISNHLISDKEKAIGRFVEGYKILSYASDEIEVYIENNVVAKMNFDEFGENPFMLTQFSEYTELSSKIEFPMILDLAHLKVSCNTLGLDFRAEAKNFIEKSDYIHLSDNDGLTDSNQSLSNSEETLSLIKWLDHNNITVTLEIYEDIEKIKSSYQLLI